MRTDPAAERRARPGGDSAVRAALRRDAIARRSALSEEGYARRSQAIRRHLRANFAQLAALRVGFYWPMNKEPDLRPVLEAWRSSGHAAFAALLPVIDDSGAALAFRPWLPDMAMVADRYGIPIPAAGAFLQPQALLIPLLAFDAAGFRLGYGGGYFDRTLAGLRPRPLAVGVGFELSRVDSIHPEPHDERLDAVITENGVLTFGTVQRTEV
ncbi:MAG: 5-formyltetrahydrofolate cyclo-ligase [Candidatus Accumulibacter sp.]|jgi:5,10-methenyltetrahydrofolate synthetase|nr:5-formyltetrahydrofolate cyclo-ligase [Accumulibacter sp.]